LNHSQQHQQHNHNHNHFIVGHYNDYS
jgi:hypothetical protein